MTTIPRIELLIQHLSTGLVASKLVHGTEHEQTAFFVFFNSRHVTGAFCAGCGHGIDFADLTMSERADKMVNHWRNHAGEKHPSRSRPSPGELTSFLNDTLSEQMGEKACFKSHAPFFTEQDIVGFILTEEIFNNLERKEMIVCSSCFMQSKWKKPACCVSGEPRKVQVRKTQRGLPLIILDEESRTDADIQHMIGAGEQPTSSVAAQLSVPMFLAAGALSMSATAASLDGQNVQYQELNLGQGDVSKIAVCTELNYSFPDCEESEPDSQQAKRAQTAEVRILKALKVPDNMTDATQLNWANIQDVSSGDGKTAYLRVLGTGLMMQYLNANQNTDPVTLICVGKAPVVATNTLFPTNVDAGARNVTHSERREFFPEAPTVNVLCRELTKFWRVVLGHSLPGCTLIDKAIVELEKEAANEPDIHKRNLKPALRMLASVVYYYATTRSRKLGEFIKFYAFELRKKKQEGVAETCPDEVDEMMDEDDVDDKEDEDMSPMTVRVLQ